MSDRELPSPELLRQLLRYDPETGRLFWLPRPMEMFGRDRLAKSWNKRWANAEAFTFMGPSGYFTGCIFNDVHLAHRVIWAIQTGAWPKQVIDHINGLKSDNRWENLREATLSENSQNRRSWARSTSGYLGVYWSKSKKKWEAAIRTSGKNVYLGSFLFEDEAARAYDAAAVKYHGEFANLNFTSAECNAQPATGSEP